jgi:hypothetical protein
MLLPYCSARAEETRSDAREAMAPSEEHRRRRRLTPWWAGKKKPFLVLSQQTK